MTARPNLANIIQRAADKAVARREGARDGTMDVEQQKPADIMIQLSVAPNVFAPSKARTMTMTEIATMIRAMPSVANKLDGYALHFAKFPDGAPKRELSNCGGASGVTLDFDGRDGNTVTRGDLESKVRTKGLAAIFYDSFSADETGTTFRCYLPSATLIPIEHYKSAAQYVCSQVLEIEAPNLLFPASQPYFCQPRIGREPRVTHYLGAPIDTTFNLSDLAPEQVTREASKGDDFAHMPEPKLKAPGALAGLLLKLDPDLGRLDWRTVISCIHLHLGEEGREVAREWCMRGKKYLLSLKPPHRPVSKEVADRQFNAVWEAIAKDTSFRMGAGALFNILKHQYEEGDGRFGMSTEDLARWNDSGRVSDCEPVFMPLEVPTDSSDPIGEFFRSVPVPFPMATLPPLIREWAIDQSRASGFDPGAYGYILLATFASWIDQRSRLQVSAGGYEVPPFFWAGLVDSSGGGKTPVLKASNKFIAQLNTSLVRASMNDEFDEERAEQRVEDYRRRCEEAREQNLELPPPPPNYRFRQRIIADATVEAIAEMASGNPEGLIYQTDDISTFIGSLDAYGGKGKDRAFYLGLNDTKREHPVNRKGKPPLIIEHLSGALIAGMQPGIVAGQTKGGNSEDGLFQRFTLYQMAAAGRVNLDFVTKADLDARILEIFRLAFAAGVINARLNTPARKLAEDYINVGRNERHIGRMAQSHAQKLIGYTFRIAFALHAMECLCEGRAIEAEIGVTTIASAAEIVECLRKHAITVFDQFDGGEIVDLAQYALEQILSRGLTEFTQGDLSKHNKGWVSNDKFNFNATNALALLRDRGVIANGGAGTTPVGGRPATRWIVNPELHAKLKNAAHTLAEAKRDQYQQLKVKFSALRDLRDGNVEF